MANPTPPSIPKPTSPGTSHGQVGGTAPDGKWQWNATLGDWVWVASGGNPSLHIDATGHGTPTPAQMGGDFSDQRSAEERIGVVPDKILPGAPGSSLDVGQSQESRAGMDDLLSSLQQQAATGGGAWEGALDRAAKSAQATAAALGQTQTNAGGNYASGLRNIGNAQSAAAQRAVGHGNILREQSKASAQDQLSALLEGQGRQDVSQAASEAAARQGTNEANLGLQRAARGQLLNTAGGTAQALMSDGGRVPGNPKVFGDDERNDTQPAMLSPGEIVVPLSATKDPDMAANFARAIAMRHAPHMADGGYMDRYGRATGIAPMSFDSMMLGPQMEAQSIENGGSLPAEQAYATHANMMDLARMMQARANGNGGTAPQTITNAADDTIAGAMQHQQQANAANVMAEAAAAQMRSGGQAAATAGNEQASGGRSLAHALQAQRSNDLDLARAQQQAAWRQTEMNAGVSSENQALLGRLVGGAAQGFGALSSAAGSDKGEKDKNYSLGDSSRSSAIENAFNDDSKNESSRGDFPENSSDEQYASHGGVIIEEDERERMHRFLKQLGKKAA